MKHMKKILSVALIVMSIFAIALPAMAENVRYNTGGVHVRKSIGSSTSYGTVNSGTIGRYVTSGFDSTGREWTCVYFSNYKTLGLTHSQGWSWAQYVDPA